MYSGFAGTRSVIARVPSRAGPLQWQDSSIVATRSYFHRFTKLNLPISSPIVGRSPLTFLPLPAERPWLNRRDPCVLLSAASRQERSGSFSRENAARRSVNTVRPGRESSSTAPPMRSASSRAIARPSPVPDARAPSSRLNRTKTRSCSSAGMPGPASSTRSSALPATIRTAVPGGVCRSALSTSARPIWSTRSWSAEHDAPVVDLHLERVLEPAGDGCELLAQILGDRRELDGLVLEPHRAGIEPREVEQVGGELREPLDLLGHRLEELTPGGLVEILVAKELEKAAQRENRRPELVRGVGDELAAGVVEAREPQAHPIEGAGQLAELVAAVILDRLVEITGGDPLGSALEPANPAREDGRGAETRQERDAERPRGPTRAAGTGRDRRLRASHGAARRRGGRRRSGRRRPPRRSRCRRARRGLAGRPGRRLP